MPEGRQLFSDLTVDENLTVGGYARPFAEDAAERDRVFSYFPRLYERRRQLAGSLSGGEQQMLSIGRALMGRPRLLLVDELSLGLTPKMVDSCLGVLLKLKSEGLGILLVEQNTASALGVADRVCVLSSGVEVFQGNYRASESNGVAIHGFPWRRLNVAVSRRPRRALPFCRSTLGSLAAPLRLQRARADG